MNKAGEFKISRQRFTHEFMSIRTSIMFFSLTVGQQVTSNAASVTGTFLTLAYSSYISQDPPQRTSTYSTVQEILYHKTQRFTTLLTEVLELPLLTFTYNRHDLTVQQSARVQHVNSLPKHNINNKKFAGLEVCAIGGFMSSTQNSLI